MSENKGIRLSKLAREFNVGISTIVDFLRKKGIDIDPNPNTKVPSEIHDILMAEYSSDITVKKESEKLSMRNLRESRESISLEDVEKGRSPEEEDEEEEVLIKDMSSTSVKGKKEEVPDKKSPASAAGEKAPAEEKKAAVEKAEKEKETAPEKPAEKEEEPGTGKKAPRVVGKIDLEEVDRKKEKKEKPGEKKKEKEAAGEPGEQKEKEEKAKEPEKEAEKPAAKVEEKKKAAGEKEKAKGPARVEKEKEPKDDFIESRIEKLTGPTVVGKIDLPAEPEKKKPVASSSDQDFRKKKRKRIRKDKEKVEADLAGEEGQKKTKKGARKKKKALRPEINEEDVQKQVKDTLARLTAKGKSKGSKYRREKREAIVQRAREEAEQKEKEKNVLQVTEFVSVNELANMMDVPVNEVIATCMNLGLFVSINQRLDAETMSVVADEFGYKVEFVSVDLQEGIREEEERPEDLQPRPPIVTVMGHVDHGKTKLLDYIRSANVVAGEAGGITQHIGAYSVTREDGKMITFLDTPGHEAFTAMRARGAQVTDVAIIVVAADDGVMPQTVEAINHAQAAGVPIVFAINKIDKPNANTEKIKEELANMNLMVEDWGGKYQSQEISAKTGKNVDDLLEKVLLEAEMLDLKANPNKRAVGTVVESSLDRGRGYIATLLVKAGTLRMGDVILAGSYYGHIKALFNERGKKIEEAGPSTPVMVLGLNGAPQAGEYFHVMESDREAKEIATKREQLQREQELRTTKHITLDEIGRRIAIGNFQELNIIVKGDVDGSVEAISDALIKLSTENIQVNVIHKAVGQISETDVMLAAASNAIIVGFQVRPSLGARRLAEKEQIDIRLYSIIYDAINEIKDAMEGMLSPEIKEEIVATLEVRETFRITKVGTVAGCIVREGKITRNTKVRVIREGIVVYTGELGSLKRFKEDVKEVASGYECGLNIQNFNDIKVGDIIEGYQEVEVKKTL
ncbi:MAG TPA: translation initiation factor IF-2 [Bacteroidetes bacterium]|nr:translation initiation factor IF-2 [Bacteroidota bacterium]